MSPVSGASVALLFATPGVVLKCFLDFLLQRQGTFAALLHGLLQLGLVLPKVHDAKVIGNDAGNVPAKALPDLATGT